MRYLKGVLLTLIAICIAAVATAVSTTVAHAQASVVVTKTVGIAPAVCANNSTVTVPVGTNVFYCVTVENTGDVDLTAITIDDPALNIVDAQVNFPVPLPPNAPPIPLTNATAALSDLGPVPATEDTVNTLSYVVTTAEDETLSGTAAATVNVEPLNAAAVVTKTVGSVPGCADESELSIPAGLNVFYCLRVENTGNVAFNSITITDTNVGLTNETFTFPALPPGTTLPLPGAVITGFASVPITTDTTNTLSYLLEGPSGESVSGTATATVNIEPTAPSAVVTKTVGIVPGCADTSELTLASGLNVFYCLRVKNTGNIPFTSISITDPNLGLTNEVFTFTAPLPSQAPAVSIRSADVTEFGPVPISENTVNTISYELTGIEGSTTSGTATATVNTEPASAAAVVTKTVGTGPQCAESTSISVVSGTNVFYCLRVENTGNVLFNSVTITDTNVGLTNATVTFPPLPPGTTLPLPSTVITEFAAIPITAETVNTLSYKLMGTEGSTVSGEASATVSLEAAAPSAVVTKTVGTTQGCADSSQITVATGTPVFYCLRVENTGNVRFESISITDPALGMTDEVVTFPTPLPSGATLPLPSAVIDAFGPVTITQSTVNTLNYTLTGTDDSTVSGDASATVNTESAAPGAVVTKTVGITPGCADISVISLSEPTNVFYCLRVENTGNVDFESITITDENVSLEDETVTFVTPLSPGETLPLPTAVITAFGPISITERTVNTLAYTLTGSNDSTVEGTASATVNVGAPIADIELEKTVGTEAEECASTSTLTVPGATLVYYCFTVTNTGSVTLTEHDLEDSELGVLLDGFDFELTPGLSTSAIVSETIAETTSNTATWTATSADGEMTATDTASATVTPDVDGDGTPDESDDSDGDGINDDREGTGDADGDGLPNWNDPDANNNGQPDGVDGTGDADGDGIPNFLDLDFSGSPTPEGDIHLPLIRNQ